MSTRRALPWRRRQPAALVLERLDADTHEPVARVCPGPALTFWVWLRTRPGEQRYGFVSSHDAQRWADFELKQVGYTLTPGPLDPPPFEPRPRRGTH